YRGANGSRQDVGPRLSRRPPVRPHRNPDPRSAAQLRRALLSCRIGRFRYPDPSWEPIVQVLRAAARLPERTGGDDEHIEPPQRNQDRCACRSWKKVLRPGLDLGVPHHTSRLATLRAFDWMKSRRGSTRSPIRVEKVSSAESAWLILTCNSERISGSSVVSHNCSGFISPRPL